MRPVPIPNSEIWQGSERRVFSAPDGNLLNPLIAPVEALVDKASDGVPRFSVMCALEANDLTKLEDNGHVWVSFYGGIVPFSVDIKRAGE